MKPKEIEVYKADLLDIYEDEATGFPLWKAAFTVLKGTYVRSLARDIGSKLGCGAHIKGLFRSRVGDICAEDAIRLDELREAQDAAKLAYSKFIDPLPLLDVQAYELNKDQFSKVENGIKIKLASQEETLALCYNGQLKAIYERDISDIFKARVVFSKGIFCEEA
ncbi:MAG: hypothetical protein HUJ51_03500 [Eggerthellaceae bacterium]|nr:hypothetical protein [Eggerthellaceae bacterium]